MKLLRFCSAPLSLLAVLVATAALTLPLHADTIAWTDWTSATAGNPGSATGTIALGSGITVTYAGQNNGLLLNYPSWNPATTFSGGNVSNAPPHANNSVKLTGGSAITETITFSSAITNPVMAIWSLGAPNSPASFNFTDTEPFSIQSGGGSAEYGGSTITQSGNDVLGHEGDGVIQFDGTFTQITFTTPTFENYYAFTVGAAGASTVVTPEPAPLALFGLGLASLPLLRRSFFRFRS